MSGSEGIEVLVDLAPTLAPFYEDQRRLTEDISLLFGTEKTSVLSFDKNPFEGAGSGVRFDWQTWTPPKPARPILLLTDLGIGSDPDAFDLSEPFDWRSFVHAAHEAGCEPLALIPYPLHRRPAYLVDVLPILPWDRSLTLHQVRKALGRRWEVTG